MKRVVIAFVLSGIIIFTCTISNIFMNRYIDSAMSHLQAIEETVEKDDYEESYRICGAMYDNYKEKENLLISCMYHQDLEKIPITIKEVQTLIRYSDEKGTILAELEKLEVTLEDIKETNNISFSSIF